MGGESKTSQTQSSTTNPWEPATPALRGILGQVQSGLNNTGLTSGENWGLASLIENANKSAAQFNPQINSFATSLLNGGGATDQAGNVSQSYNDYTKALNGTTADYRTALTGANTTATANLGDLNRRLSGIADGSGIGANSGLAPYLQTLRDDITNSTNSQFAAAGRDFSGSNSMALGRGIAQGLAPVIAQQYNTDNQARIDAAKSLYDAGNTTGAFTTGNLTAGYGAGRSAADAAYGAGNNTAGLLAAFQQQQLANQGQGVAAAGAASEAANAPANAALQAEAMKRGLPVQALGLLAQIGIPIAGLGGQSTGQSQGTQQMSGAQQFATIAGGIGSLGKAFFPGGL